MAKNKTETLSIRVEPGIKNALRAAAEKHHRSLANMVEVMVMDFCSRHHISVPVRARRKSDVDLQGENNGADVKSR